MLSRPERRTLIANAFRLPGMASKHERMIANEMHRQKGPGAGRLPYNPCREVGFGCNKDEIRRRRALIYAAINSEPVARADLIRKFPNFSECAIRNDLCRMVTNGQIARTGSNMSITYVRASPPHPLESISHDTPV